MGWKCVVFELNKKMSIAFASSVPDCQIAEKFIISNRYVGLSLLFARQITNMSSTISSIIETIVTSDFLL